MDPSTATILDCQLIFDNGFEIEQGFDSVTVEDLTILNVYENFIRPDEGSFETTVNNVWCLKGHSEAFQADGGEIFLNNCVFGWAGDDGTKTDGGDPRAVLTNCDVFLSEGGLVESEFGNIALRNCILYAGSGNNELEIDGGTITVRSSVLWDPFSDEQDVLGGIE